jgi:hypothetical protein
MDPAVGFLCIGIGVIVGLLIGILIAAVIFRAAVSMYNSLAGGPSSPSAAPEPSFGLAMGIVFVNWLINMVISIILNVAAIGISGGAPAPGDPPNPVTILLGLISIPISLMVMGGVVSMMLPTTFLRGLLISLCYLVIGIAIACVIGLLIGGLMAVMGGLS